MPGGYDNEGRFGDFLFEIFRNLVWKGVKYLKKKKALD